MANPWFRMWAEFADDPKVQRLSEAMQRRLVMLLCYRCGNVLETLHETEIAKLMRITEEQLSETKEVFTRSGFITEGWRIVNWNKRQFLSDSSTPRVKKHREAKRQGGKRNRNADETLHETFQERRGNGAETPYRVTDIQKEKELSGESSKKTHPAAQQAALLPDDWELPEDWGEFMRMQYALAMITPHPGEIENTAAHFAAHMRKEGRRSANWGDEWRVWTAREIKRRRMEGTQKPKGGATGRRISVTESHRQFLEELDREYPDLDEGGDGEGGREGGGGVRDAERLLAHR